MDISCGRCGKPHVLDESKVPEAGLVVRCVACGHSFRVRRRELLTTEPVGGEEILAGPSDTKPWLIRQHNGQVITFEELITLRSWIAERKVTREDEISRGGGVWRRVGSIPEFEGLFEAAASEAAAVQFQTTAPFEPSPFGQVPTGPSVPSVAPQAPSLAPRISDLGSPVPEHPFRPPERPPRPLVPPDPEYTLGDSPAAPSSAWLAASDFARSSAAARVEGPPQARPASGDESGRSWAGLPASPISVADELEDEDAFERKLRGRGRWKWVLLFSLLGVGLVTAALYAFDRPWFLRILGMEDEAPVASEQVPDLDPALEARRRDDLNGAEAVLQDALQRAPGQPRLLTALSDVYATWADYLGEVGETDQARQRSEASLARAEEALATTPESVEVRVARANALRVAGRNAEAQALATELATAKVGGALLCYVQGALAATEANRLDAAERSLQESLAQDSSFWRAHVKLARLARERRDYAAAKKHLEAILAALPAHPFAKRLLDGLPATTPPLPDAAAPPASAPPIPALAPPPAPKAPPAGAPKKLSLKQLLKMGHRLRESNPRKALKLFEEVQSEGPSAAAHHGKGWAYLELGELTLASREFQRALDLGFHGDSYIGLGTAYRRLGQREKARRAFERYLEKYPNGEEAPVAKTSLESLK